MKHLFKELGAEIELFKTDDHRNPIVFARFKANAKKCPKGKTILFYGHYDVVAADDKEQTWNTAPFEVHGINGYLYGRGVSDNKGPVLAALYAVADISAAKRLASDIVFLIEGEEESGSRGFREAIRKNKHIVGDVDWILLANSYWLNDEIPCLTYGLRGVIRVTIEVKSEHPDLHSGVDGSYLVSEALKDLVALLAQLTGFDGKVAIPGFYDEIPILTKTEKEQYQLISETLITENPELGNTQSLAESFKARWREPSLTIHCVKNSGPSNSSIISRVATADLSIRLVPNQTTGTVQKALQKTLEKAFEKLDSANELTIEFKNQAEPWLGDPNNQIFRTLEEAIMAVWKPAKSRRRQSSISVNKGPSKDLSRVLKSPRLSPVTSSTLSSGSTSFSKDSKEISENGESSPRQSAAQKPLYIREGGSIPAIRFLEQEFNAPAAHLPCGQASDSAHLDNERIRLLNLYKSREIFKKVFELLPLR